MTQKKKKVRKVTLGLVLSWVFGVIFSLSGFGAFISLSFIEGIILIIMSLVILPPMNKLFKEKMNFELSIWLKITIIIVLFIVLSIVLNSHDSNVNVEPQIFSKGEKAKIGNFVYTIHKFEQQELLGNDWHIEESEGVFILTYLTIENVGKEPEYFSKDNVMMMDVNDLFIYEPDTTAEIYLPENYETFSFEKLQPKLPKSGWIVFDVPYNMSFIWVIKHNNFFSNEEIYVK